MAKASKQGASRKTSKKASSSEATKKKATKAKKPAAAKKAAKPKAAVGPKRKVTAAKRSAASTIKKITRKAKPVGVTRKVAATSPKVKSAKKATSAKPTIAKSAAKGKSHTGPTTSVQAPVKPAPGVSHFLGAAPAEYHSPATTVAKMKAAAASANKAATAPKKAIAPKKAQRRTIKATTLVVSPAAIDTSLAAEVAANMVLNHMMSGPAAGHLERAVTAAFTRANQAAPSAPKRETSTFKHMKQAVANPTSHHLDSLFGVLATKKRPALPFSPFASGASQPINKDFGLDVRRTNLPRRKAG